MTMDIKDIIKWFIPCFHVLLKQKLTKKLILLCLFLFINLADCSRIKSELVVSENVGKDLDKTQNIDLGNVDYEVNKNLSQSALDAVEKAPVEKPRSLADTSAGRTFGPRFKKMMAGMLPLIFQIGAASTWAVVAALVGVKTLAVTLFILKLLLIAGAAKIGALFGGKAHHHQGWETPQQKEIHLHIHNGGHGHEHEEHVPISAWSREGYTTAESKPVYAYDPYMAGPQTISTPYGNYVKIDPKYSNPPLLSPIAS